MGTGMGHVFRRYCSRWGGRRHGERISTTAVAARGGGRRHRRRRDRAGVPVLLAVRTAHPGRPARLALSPLRGRDGSHLPEGGTALGARVRVRVARDRGHVPRLVDARPRDRIAQAGAAGEVLPGARLAVAGRRRELTECQWRGSLPGALRRTRTDASGTTRRRGARPAPPGNTSGPTAAGPCSAPPPPPADPAAARSGARTSAGDKTSLR